MDSNEVKWKDYAPFYEDERLYEMKDKPTKELVREMHQAMFGVADTDDNGFAGDIKEIKADVKSQNGKVGKLSNRVYWLYGILSAMGVTGGLGIAGVFG